MIYINPLTIGLFIFFAFFGNLPYFLICYVSMFIHELCHMAAALIIGLVPEKIKLQPYGVSLTLKNKIIYSIYDEVVLYLSGPCANIVIALLTIIIFRRSTYIDYFYVCNIMLFFMNILPVEPLDGGSLLKKILMRYTGIKTAGKIMRVTSIVFFVLFISIGMWIIYRTGFNISVLLVAVLLLINAFTQDEKYNVDLLGEFVFYKERKEKNLYTKTQMIVAEDNVSYAKLAENFRLGSYSICFLTKDKKLTEIKTETQIIEELLK